MAEIKPFRAWRYNQTLSEDIESLTSPLFDVVSEKQRLKLRENPYNSIHISVPNGANPTDDAAALLKEWKEKGIIKQDPVPGIYVYYQYFSLHGSDKELCRKGFICFIRTYDWDEEVILRHENTIPKAVNDRTELLEKTELNVSPTHGLYTDPTFELEKYMDESMKAPIYETEDYQGVRDVLSVIQDAKIIKRFLAILENRQVILADGHHRYEGSLAYCKSATKKNPNHTGNEGYNYHMMYFTNTETDDLRILPTHRLINGIEGIKEEDLLKKVEEDFIIKPIEDAFMLSDIILGKKWAFGLLFKDSAYKIRLKPERFETMTWKFPEQVRELDLTVMHYFVIEKALGIPGKEQRSSDKIIFDRSFPDCMNKVYRGEAQMALITKDITMNEVKRVCYSGYTMPQKSTYFYPKAICGFLFGSIKEDEFQSPPYACF
ncbi:MAG: DUF1015 domain-containing protein [Candidatus Cyclobacteriaceae bacterium M2_1C_046]